MESITKVRIDMREKIVELEGSEEFVSKQLTWIKGYLTSESLDVDEPDSPESKTDNSAKTTEGDGFVSNFGITRVKAENAYHFEDDKFRIITKKIKGNNAEKQTHYMLLYCLAKEHYGEFESSYQELRDLCKQNSCLDSGNFSANVKTRKDLFVVENKKVKLTSPGRTKARELLSSLCEKE